MKKSKLIILFVLSIFILTGCNINDVPIECTHEESSWIIDSEATCSNVGKKHIECIKCHETLKEEEIEKLPHSLIHHEGLDATCTEVGYKAYDTCKNCSYSTYEEIEKLPHNLIHHEGLEATCTSSGYKAYDTCKDCDYSTFKEIKIKDHILIHHEGLDATCTKSGYKAYDTCANCTYSTYETISAKGHTLIHHEGKEPTETSSGYKAYDTCANCDYSTYQEILYQKHNFVNYVCTECFESSPENLKYELMEDESGYCVVGLYNPHSQIKKIVIPDEYNGKPVVGVNLNGFLNCYNLNYLELSDNTLYIGGDLGNSLFYNEYDNGYYLGSSNNPYIVLVRAKKQDIETIKVNKDTKIIYEYALSECTSLKNIIFEEGIQLTSIMYGVFQVCTGLEKIYYEGTIEDWCNITFSNYKSNPMTYAQHFYMLDSNKEYKEVAEIVIPDTITEIGYYQFYGFSNITSITLSSSVTSIGSYAFYGCTSLTNITIPSSVTSIGSSAFNGCTSLTNITIPSSVTSIGSSAFYGCTSLTSITIPEGVTSIGSSAFEGCTNLTNITIPESVTSIGSSAFYGCTSLTSITIPESVTSIGYCAFSGCTSIENITIPSSVTSIGNATFYGCTNLKELIFEENSQLVSIEYRSFSGCASLESITIPEGVTSIGSSAFEGCNSLTSISLPFIGGSKDSNTSLIYIFGVSGSSYINDIQMPSSLKEVIILEGCTTISSNAFNKCDYIETIKIPSSVNYIKKNAFEGSYNLKNIIVDENNKNYKSIDGNLYTKDGTTLILCTKASGVIFIPQTVKYIDDDAFDNAYYNISIYCEVASKPSGWPSIFYNDFVYWNVKYFKSNDIEYAIKQNNSTAILMRYIGDDNKLEIPTEITYDYNTYNVTSIGRYAFKDCAGLTNIYYKGTMEDWCNISFSSDDANPMYYAQHFYMLDSNNEYQELTEIVIPDSITEIGDYQFCGFNNITSITIPSSVTSIGYSAFSGCTSLESITIPESVTSIGSSAFYNCKSLKNITIPSSVTSIGYSVFSGCTGLTNITIPSSVTSIGFSAFSGCTGLTIYCEATSQPGEWSIDWNVNNISQVYWGINDNNYVIINNIEFVLDLNDLTATISNYTGNSTILEIPSIIKHNDIEYSVTSIGDSAFYNCTSLESIIIPNTITNIGNYVFWYCTNLISITIPANVVSIGEDVFWECACLSNIFVDENNENYKSIDGNLYTKDGTILIKYAIGKKEKEFTVPSSVTTIKAFAFQDCKNLTNITIPSSVTSIEYSAFYGCTSLTSIIIPESVTSIEYAAFYGCTSLTSIIIPESVTSIGSSAFNGCTSLTNITIPTSVTSIGYYAFYNCASLESITIPEGVTSIGNSAFYGCTSLTIYCEASSKPSDWNKYWNYSNCPVVWGYKQSSN